MQLSQLSKRVRLGEGAHGKVYLYEYLPDKENRPLHALPQFKIIKKLKRPSEEFGLRNSLSGDCRFLVPFEAAFQKVKPYSKATFLVMPLLFPLKQVVLSREQVRLALRDLLTGLLTLHENGVLHRDVKPDNLFLNEQGRVLLGDFSISARKEISMSPAVYTRYYKPPELIYGLREYGFEADIWAAGCTYVQLLKGEPLFKGDHEIDQLACIVKLLGCQADSWEDVKKLPNYFEIEVEKSGIGMLHLEQDEELVSGMLDLNPGRRLDCRRLLERPELSECGKTREKLRERCLRMKEELLSGKRKSR